MMQVIFRISMTFLKNHPRIQTLVTKVIIQTKRYDLLCAEIKSRKNDRYH